MRIKYTFICLLLSLGIANAQYQNYVLKTPDDATKTYIGRDYIRLLPGYSFKATAATQMKAQINAGLTPTDVNTFLSAANPTGSTNTDALTAINTSLAVGQIPISSSVSPSGAKCYNVPIDIVTGRQSFQPNISLSYNSQAGNGVVGMGWSISGLSSIQCVGKNMYFDGVNDTPLPNFTGEYALDGVRLIKTSTKQIGNNASFAIEYETVQGNTKVTAIAMGGIIQTFKVLYPNGDVSAFGDINGVTPTLNFPIKSITDINGNTITFSYKSDNADLNSGTTNEVYYIDEINYGQCSDKPNFAKIKFTYETRPDQIFSLESTKSCVYRQRLSKIESFANPDLIRTYSLNYSNADPRITSNQNDVSRLTQIGCSANSESLNPLKLYYGEGGTLTTSTQSTTLGSSNFDLKKIKMVRGKFDPNIQNDALLVYPDSAIYKNGSVRLTFALAYPSSEQIKIYQNLNNKQSDPTTLAVESGFLGLLSANIDGIGSDEVIKINSAGISQYAETVKFKIYKPGKSTGLFFDREIDYVFNAGLLPTEPVTTTIIPKEFYSGNFTGEGKTEILCIPKRNLFTNNVKIIDLKSITPVFSGNLFTRPDNDLILAIDIDSDGQTELLHVTTTQTDLYKYKLNIVSGGKELLKIGQWPLTTTDFISKTSLGSFVNNTPGTISKTDGETNFTYNNQVFFADLNGDGKIDIIKAPLRVSRHYKYSGVCVRSLKCIKCGALYGNFTDCQAGGCPVCHDRQWVGSLNEYCVYSGPGHPSWFESIINKNVITCTDFKDPKTGNIVINTHVPGTCPEHGCVVDYEYDWNKETHNDWTIYYTDGVNMPVKKTFTGPNCNGDSEIFIQDTDGDNVPELIVDGDLYAYRDKDHIFDATSFISTNIIYGSEIIPFDINSDKTYNQLVALSSTGIQKVTFSQNRAKNNLVSLMINSLGVADKTDYDQLYQGANYTPGTQASFPNTDFVGSLWISTQNSTMYNKKLLSNTTYSYAGAILHKQGLGLRGFTSLKATDLMTNKIATTTFDPYKTGVVIGQSSDNAESSFKYNFTDYDSSTGGNKKMKLLLTDKTVTDKLKGNTVSVNYPLANYDSYGNPGKEITDFGGGIKTTVENTFENRFGTINLIGLLTNRKITNERDGKTAIQSEGYEYDTNNRLHYSRKYIYLPNISTPKLLTETEYKYFSYGTVSDEIVHNMLTNDILTTSYTYWPDDQYSLKTKTDPMGLTTTYSYNFNKRRLTGVTDYLTKSLSYGYDNWGRKNQEVRPDGTTTDITLVWNNESEPKRLIKETQTATGQPESTKYADALGRETRTGLKGLDGTYIFSDKEYDNYGRLSKASDPYSVNSSPLWTNYRYDENDRIQTISKYNGSTTNYIYSDNTVTENKDGVSTVQTTDATGKLLSSTNAAGTVIYSYRPDGQPNKTIASGIEATFEYDNYGRQYKLVDPSAGTVVTEYDDANRTVTQTWDSGKKISTVANKYGQPINKTTPDFVTTYRYINGLPESISSTNGTSRSFEYDDFGRLRKLHETANGKNYNEVYSYNSGRLESTTFSPLDFTVNYKYKNGYLYRLEDSNGNRLREVNSVNASGMEKNVLFGNGLTTQKNYTDEGLCTNVKTFNPDGLSNIIQNMSFDFNRLNGTLNSRTDNTRGLTESFTYGDLFRLKTYGITANPQTVGYYPNGNINTKTDVGAYSYDVSGKPYTLSSVNTNSDLKNELNINYTVMSRPTTISNANGLSATFSYNDDYDRTSMQVKQDGVETISKYYLAGGRCEIETIGGVEKKRLYLDGSPYTASILVEKVGSAAAQTYYLHRDYLGSVTQISDNNGNLAAEYSYDPWGRMRDVTNWQVYAANSQPDLKFGRGYTGHEHLNQFGLINMNARLYDPILGRFLAADPLVSTTLDFNRYVYARNNPMMFTDPTGESWKSFWRDFGNAFVRDFKKTFGGIDGVEFGFGSGGGFRINATRGGVPYGPSMTGSFKSNPNFNQIVRQSEYNGLQSNNGPNALDYAYDHSENLMQNYLLTTNPASGLTIVYGTMFDKLSRGGADIDISYVHDEDLTKAYWVQYITTNYPHEDKKYSLSNTYNADNTVSYWDDSHSGGNRRFYSISEMKDHIFRKYEVTFADRPARDTRYQPYVSWNANLFLINNGHPILRINYGFKINNGIINVLPYNYYFYPIPRK